MIQPPLPIPPSVTSELRAALADAAEFLEDARRVVALTGAGVSTESGIPDFRGEGGLWTRVAATSYRAFLSDAQARKDYWRIRRELMPLVTRAQPNAAHRALAKLDRRGALSAVVTQNFDGLHQAAGIPTERVIELHGNTREAVCQSCGARQPIGPVQARVEAGEEEPLCACGGFLKAATILFGQPLPQDALDAAKAQLGVCDLLLVVGSSLRVTPAARLPLIALERGAPLIIVNLEPTPLDARADVVIRAPAGWALERMVDRLFA
ncbi:MAG TPA: Sir2 family NAD-dependent protein deacetylase [Ktedonobacterales bacterium]|nr:Sir2 family NAD-dependent protein deacetylase [Ktedonobacterales bacterium]